MGLFKKKSKAGGSFQFRVSDAVQVPRRGYLLRLKVVSGTPALDDVSPGSRLRVTGPGGSARVISVKDFSATEGFPSQDKLDHRRELDIVIDQGDGLVDGQEIQIGWLASGPVED